MTMPGTEIAIRVATALDHGAVVQLMHELVDELGPPDAANRLKERIGPDMAEALASSQVRIFLACDGLTPIGLSRGDVLVHDPIFRLRDDQRCGYVDQMYVRVSYRRAGVGAQLLSACESWFRELGIQHALLHAAPRAVRFYAREGYLPNREMFKRLL